MFCRYQTRICRVLDEFNWVVIETKSRFYHEVMALTLFLVAITFYQGACNVADSILSGACKGRLTRERPLVELPELVLMVRRDL